MRIRKKAILSLTLALGMFTTQMLPTDAYQKETVINKQGKVYNENEIVTLIVELETAPLAQSKNTRSSVNEEMLMEEHEEVRSDIQQVIAPKLRSSLTSEYDYTKVFNGFTLETEYGNIDKIKAVEGVKDVYVSQAIKLVEPVESTQEIPEYNSYVNMVNAPSLWAKGIKGQGKKIAIIDTGIDLEHEAFQQIDTNEISMNKETLQKLMSKDDKLQAQKLADIDVNSVYYNEKIPFQFDYADKDANVRPEEDYIDDLSHGTHVAGIAAGFKESKDGVVKFTGIAPQAQLLIMKVSSTDGHIYDEVVIAALEDSYALEADSINLSLGSPAGFSNIDSLYEDVLETLEIAGIDVIYGAGNDIDAAYNPNTNGKALTSNPDRGIVNRMGTSIYATSVAGVNNSSIYIEALGIKKDNEDIMIPRMDSEISMSNLLLEGCKEKTFTYEYAGVATDEAFMTAIKEGKDFKGKIVLAMRGENSLKQKIDCAATYGAIGIIIFDDIEEDLISIAAKDLDIPACMITLKDGNTLLNELRQGNTQVTIYREKKFIEDEAANRMYLYTSMGCTPDLKLKPEISAPADSIYSALPKGKSQSGVHDTYGLMSGTSMATPNYTGMSILMRQYIEQLYVDHPSLKAINPKMLIKQMLMSGATPFIDETNHAFYSPRIQGAGVVNADNTIKANAYLSTIGEDEKAQAKIELGDDPDKIGEYNLIFKVHNLSDQIQNYRINTTVLMDGIDQENGNDFISKTAYPLKDEEVEIEGIKTVSVEANSTKEVSIKINLTQSGKARYEQFENGDFVEGFVQLVNQDNDTTLTIPYLGFYGNWAQAPILESISWLDDQEAGTAPFEMTTKILDEEILLGSNMLDENQDVCPTATLAISPNNDSYMDEIESVFFGQYRNAKKITYQIENEQGKVVFKEETYNISKSMYDSTMDMIFPNNAYPDKCVSPFTGKDKNGNVLPDGEYTYKIKAEIDYKTSEGNALDHYDIKFMIDTKKPSIDQVNVEKKNGKYILVAALQDDNSLMGYRIYDKDENVLEQIVYGDEKQGSIHFDASDYVGKTLTIETIDYAYNKAEKEVVIQADETKPIVITGVTIEGKQSLKVGETQQLKANVIPENANIGKLTWLSSDSNIATVDGFGLVKGMKEGKVSISVTTENGVTDKLDIMIVKASVTPDSSDKKEENSKETIDKSTDTGDHSQLADIVGMLMISGCMMIGIRKRMKQK